MKEYFCIGSVVPFDQINHSQLNNSKAKQTFTFGKSQRFSDCKPTCKQLSYGSIKYRLHPKGTKIGTQQRKFLNKSNENPSPSHYETSKQLAKEMSSLTFGNSRENIKANNYLFNSSALYPSSTKYETSSKLKAFFRTPPSYSLRKKTMIQNGSVQSPGPAQYNLRSCAKNDNLQMTKYKSISFSTGKSKRFSSEPSEAPAPNRYKYELNSSKITGAGNSQYKTCSSVKFGVSRRKTYIDESVKETGSKPGPGNYRMPSQFGQYDGNVYSSFDHTPKYVEDLLNAEQVQQIKAKVMERPSTSKH